MPSLRDVKRRITSISNTSKVTHALEAVSATKMRRWQERTLSARPFAIKAIELLAELKKRSPMYAVIKQGKLKPDAPILMIVISADKGLCGGHNARLMARISNFQFPISKVAYIALGRYGRDYLKRRQKEIIMEEVGFGEHITRERIKELYEFIEEGFSRGTFAKVLLAYTEFQTTLKQEPKVRQLLPVDEEELRAIVESITPRSGKYAELQIQNSLTSEASVLRRQSIKIQNFEYMYEPSAKDIIPSLIRQLIQVAMFHMVLESNASEHSARMIAMKSATDNAKEFLKTLNLQYNKARQGEITKGVLEVAAGAEAFH